ncbi:MAG TPA: hypothetical protein GXZ74_03860 [Tissierellia bacterium]|nr:hypothetical protein [Tissierellia bacterium]
MRTKNGLIFFLIVLLLAAIIATGYIMAAFYGNPFVKWRATGDMRHYVLSQYPHLIDPRLSEIRYNFKDESYATHITADNAIDMHFDVFWQQEEMWDNYAHAVTGGQNTRDRLGEAAALDIARELRSLGSFEVFVDATPEEAALHFPMDTAYERGRIPTGQISLLQQSSLISAKGADEGTAEYLASLIPRIYEILERQGFATRRIDLTLSNQNYISQYHVFSITPADAAGPDLEQRLRELERSFYSNPEAAFQQDELRVIIQ